MILKPIILSLLSHLVTKFTAKMSSAKPALTTDISNYGDTGYGDLSQTMKALTWQGKNQVKLGRCIIEQLMYSLYLKVD